ncbi:uncharacterized protein [Parasteatoda tepidariorum]|uniref:uncharacterized protein n=1 Tax=Parasteatoda tepidariorum TaxID=114398 RepID=UPI001C71B2A5|nr:uncharacterized protein LOC107442011 [Parasteatoda tepidariorum]XP_042901162.1 uncharacterized protein LOC107442011 [Parasteatoda tepidariorum]XP_042901163.1 uncharacterized protein LOC107442011 [Parasteatoda tepidariorum]
MSAATEETAIHTANTKTEPTLEVKKTEESVIQIENVDEVLPKISHEARHSIGSYETSAKDKFPGVSSSLGNGGGRSNRPSQSEKTLAKSQSEIQVCHTNSLSVSQTSKNSVMTFSSSGTFYGHSKKKAEVRIPPKPPQSSSAKDAADFRQMEQGLLQLLEDFHSGKLAGFGSSCTFEKMENVREQQEKLARLHFDLNAQQEIHGQYTAEGINMAKGNLSKLMDNLQQLSLSIEQLQTDTCGTAEEK